MKRLEEQLVEVSKPSVDLPLHCRRLRRVLLNSSHSRFGSFNSIFMSFSRLVPTTVALVLLLALTFGLRPQAAQELVTPKASAQELVNDAVDQVRSLTSEQIEALNQRLGVDTTHYLLEAQEANDLRFAEIKRTEDGSQIIIEFADAQNLHLGTAGVGEGLEDVGTEMDFDDLTWVEYSSPDFSAVYLGLYPDGIPGLIVANGPVFNMSDGAYSTTTVLGSPVGKADSDALTDGTSDVKPEDGCSSWQSDDGMIGGGGC